MNNSEAFNSNLFEQSSADIPGLVVFRNNCGMLYNEHGIPTRFGVANQCGGSDFIGWYNGLFCAFEIKADKDNTQKDRLTKQENFIAQVNAAGGFAGFVRRPIDIQLILTRQGCVKLSEYPKARLG